MTALATTTTGAVAGIEKDGVVRFAGIPYAAPPVGERRFLPPAPALPWTGVRECRSFGSQSWQAAGALGGLLTGPEPVCDEDCLTLNVQTPGVDGERRPVMVWIHGGGFVGGTGATPWYNGTSFVRRGDVVVVSINYRLGALGFLHLGALGGDEYASSGLSGILDQVAALEWVRDNIAAFGGDPDNVTIFGESAGGMSVGTLLGMPAARGLFHRAIAQSGAASNLHDPDRAAAVTDQFCQALGVRDLDGLLAATPAALLAAQQALTVREAGLGLGLPFQPVVDGRVLPEPPLDAVRGGLNADVPLMTGTTLEEFKLFSIMAPAGLDEARIRRRLARFEPRTDTIVETYRSRDETMNGTLDDVWSAIMTDLIFRMPAIHLAEAHASHGHAHTYLYRFSWRSTAFDGRLGACHALEIPFVFNNLDRGGAGLFLGDGPRPDALALAMHDAWWRFARTGDPNGADLPRWAPYATETRATLDFGDEVVPLTDPDAAAREVWSGVL